MKSQHLMDAAQQALWELLQGFGFDQADAQFPFSRRLARDNGWSHAFALRVVEEYRRFLFLAMQAGHPVTPSDQVDQAWHLHLVYTRSYWEDLCAGVLGQPLHHGPTKGGADEGHKFHDWYQNTLDSYERLFGERAPEDIWPDAHTRFAEAAHLRWVNTRKYWLIPRLSFPKLALGSAAALLLGLVLTGCASDKSGGSTGVLLLVGGLAVVVIVLAIAAARSSKSNRRDNDSDSSGGGDAGCGFFFFGGDGGCGHGGGDGGSGCGASGCGGGGCGGGGCGGCGGG